MKQVRYTAKIAETIIERIVMGESLRKICSDNGMPSFRAVMNWVAEDKDGFRVKYSLAMDFRAQWIFDEMLEIADNVGHEEKDTIQFEKGGETIQIPNKEWVMRSKVRVDARKWILARMAPKRYGEKITQEISGPDGGPIQTEGEFRPSPEDEAMMLRIAEMRSRLKQDQESDISK